MMCKKQKIFVVSNQKHDTSKVSKAEVRARKGVGKMLLVLREALNVGKRIEFDSI